MELAELSARHPGVPLVCGHTGGGDWSLGIRAIRAQPDVYADLGGGDPVYGEVEMAVRELGAGRVLYGSDAPPLTSLKPRAIKLIRDLKISDDDNDKIFARNAAKLLKLS